MTDRIDPEAIADELRAGCGNEYTPTTDDIKFEYAMHKSVVNSRTSATGMGTKLGVHFAEFDRWLAEHDRQVAERAWDEGLSRGFYAGQSYPDGADASEPDIDNPYRKEQENNKAPNHENGSSER